MSPRHRVAVAQMNCELGDVEANLPVHRELIGEARSQQAEVLVFPELSLTGYDLGARVPEVAMAADDPRLLGLARDAGEMLALVGFVERIGLGEFANAVACLQNGEVLAVHRKVNLCTYGGHEEGKVFSKGQRLTQVTTRGLACGVTICADLWNPGLVHAAMLERPDVLLTSINSASGIVDGDFDDQANWLTCLRFYAMMYGTPLAMAHRFGAEGEAWFWGGSCIVDARGQILARADDGVGVVSAVLEMADIEAARFAMPTHRDADTPLVAALMKQRLKRDLTL